MVMLKHGEEVHAMTTTDRRSSLVILASGSHGGALVFTIGVGVVLLVAIYFFFFAKGHR